MAFCGSNLSGSTYSSVNLVPPVAHGRLFTTDLPVCVTYRYTITQPPSMIRRDGHVPTKDPQNSHAIVETIWLASDVCSSSNGRSGEIPI